MSALELGPAFIEFTGELFERNANSYGPQAQLHDVNFAHASLDLAHIRLFQRECLSHLRLSESGQLACLPQQLQQDASGFGNWAGGHVAGVASAQDACHSKLCEIRLYFVQGSLAKCLRRPVAAVSAAT